MKNKIVVWGTNAADEKVLIALELKAEDNKVLLYTFPEATVTEAFYNQMMNDWKNDKPVEFPEHTLIERPLAIADSLLPDDLRADDRNGVLLRAQTEWHFVVLSTKLHEAYRQELAEFKEKITALQQFDDNLWDELRAFWDKVQEQARERNLFRAHADSLRDSVNELFEKLRQLRNQMKEEAKSASQAVYDTFVSRLEDIEKRIAEGGAKLSAVFEELKVIQRDYREAKMTNEHRNRIWDRIDKAFKAAKERRFGPAANEGSLIERLEQRVAGLKEAIQRMEESIQRDEKDLEFQKRKIATTEGQLEAQIRVAKIKMIEERLNVKQEKLKEIRGTYNNLQSQLAKAKERETIRLAKEAERKKFEEAKAAAQAEIAQQIASAQQTQSEIAASETAEEPTKEAPGDNALDVATRIISETLQDVADTARAIGQVLGEKADTLMDKAEDWVEDNLEKAEEIAEVLSEETKDVVKDLVGKVSEAAQEIAEELQTKQEETSAPEEETLAEVIVEVEEEGVQETAKAKRSSRKKAATDESPKVPSNDEGDV